ncbi:MAG: T9SS type A sorting domain-containing protein, partial [Anaerolineales bacterium]|nr:T9SS type A sorting domain-containing protein [Anaerolineales bacterium]
AGNVEDCAGECGGSAVDDECGVCGGGGIADGACDCAGSVDDCAGVCGGSAVEDECGVCGGDGIDDGACDCAGSVEDCAGVCGGSAENCPDWADDPGAYEFVATITAVVTDHDVQSSDANDILAAFDNAGNVRGTSFALDVDFGPYAGTVLHEITIRSNSAGDNITFQFYDASEDAVLELSENYSFIINDIAGSMVAPYALSVQYEIDLSIDLIAGWNWISINVLPEDASIGNVLGSLGVAADFINSQTDGASTNYASQGGPWAGALSTFEPGNMYLLKMLAPATLIVTGAPIDVAETPIELISGWNWLGYLPQNPGAVGDALASLGTDADFINSQVDGASTNYASQGGPWAGALSTLVPGKGYLLKMLAPATFTYPEFDGLARLAENKQEVVLSQKISDWDFNYGDFEFIGTITASIDSREDFAGDVVAVFVDGKCRGLAERMYFELDNTYYYMIQVYSNVAEGEELTFKYYNKTNDEITTYSETLTFESNMIVGDGFNTFGLSREASLSQPKAYGIGDAYPNPFNPVTSFEYTIPEDGMVQVAVYDLSGRMIAEIADGYMSAGTYPVTWDASELSSGIYMVHMISGDFRTMQKVMLIK